MAGLTALQVKNVRPGRHADGRGLYLLVRESGSRSWVFRAQINGKRQDFGLGAAGKLSLAQARSAAVELRDRIERGEAPRPAPAAATVKTPTFEEAARACHAAIKSGWSNKRHSDSWLTSLKLYAFPRFGDDPVDSVTSIQVRDALAPIWLTIPESARRVLQRIGTVLDYAHIEGWCPHEAALRSVTKGLPRQPVDDNHYAALPFEQLPDLMKTLQALPDTPGRDALMFTILTAARSGEARLATWGEFDLEAATWSVPASRMKMRKMHVVPLSPAAIGIVKRRWLKKIEEQELVFSKRGINPLCDMTMGKVLKDLGYGGITVHGFRSTFTDWAAEKTRVPKEVVDKALAHKLPDRVEAAYRRTDFFERRRGLMKKWADYSMSAVAAG
jgi:integrase